MPAEACDLHGAVQFQFTVNAFHLGKIQPFAIVEVVAPGGAKSHNHGARLAGAAPA